MIELIHRDSQGMWIIQTMHKFIKVASVQHYFNELLRPQLTTLDGRLKATRRLLNQTRNVPLWLNQTCCLTVIPNHTCPERIYVNGGVLSHIVQDNSKTELRFKSSHVFMCSKTLKNLKQKWEKSLEDHQKLSQIFEKACQNPPW